MSNISIIKNLCAGGIHVRNVFSLHLYITNRAITKVGDAKQYEDPELATAKPFKDIPKPPMLPFIGNSWMYLPIIGKYSVHKRHKAHYDKHRKYGEIVREKFGHFNVVTSYTPEAMEVVSRHEGKYPTRGELTSLKTYRESRPKWYKSTGVLILQGEEWRSLRTKTQKHLMKPKAIQSYLDPMQDVAKDLVRRIYYKRNTNKEVEGFLLDLYKWALESVAFVGMDTRLGCLNPNLSPDSVGMKLIESVQTQFYCINELEAFTGNFQLWKYFPSSTWKKFAKACDDFTEIAFKYINQSLDDLKKRTEEDNLTLLQAMLMTDGLDISGAMVMVADMLFAGIDTTSHSVGFLLYHLSKNPDKQKKLFDEIKNLLPNKNDRITVKVFNKFRYLKACMKESMRLHPISIGNARVLNHDVAINGYRIPAGTSILCNQQEVYIDEKYFKNPNQFIPERWMDEKLSNFFTFVPFGIGVRSCIGRRLAELEIICLMTEIIRNFNIEYNHGDIDMITTFINTPDKPLDFSFLDR